MAKRMLFGSKDMGGAEVGVPLAQAAREHDHKIVTVLEGLAAARYEAVGLQPYFRGTVDFQDKPFDFNVDDLIREIKPDVVIATMGSPINLEQAIGLAAKNAGIPLVHLSDFWGSLSRSRAEADLMLTIDEVDASITRELFSHNFRVAVVGNHAIRTLRKLTVSLQLFLKMEELKKRFDTVILFVGGGADYTTPEIALLKECLKKTPVSWVVIKRYHPKHAERISPDGRPWSEVWDGMFAEVGDCAIELPTRESGAIAAMADVTISGFSTLMITAAGARRPTIALVTPETRDSMQKQIKIGRNPLAAMELAYEVSTPCDLSVVFKQRPSQELVDSNLKPYEPEVALGEIEKLLK